MCISLEDSNMRHILRAIFVWLKLFESQFCQCEVRVQHAKWAECKQSLNWRGLQLDTETKKQKNVNYRWWSSGSPYCIGTITYLFKMFFYSTLIFTIITSSSIQNPQWLYANKNNISAIHCSVVAWLSVLGLSLSHTQVLWTSTTMPRAPLTFTAVVTLVPSHCSCL
jgi:hypothetical protein